jgi:signal transduction histidine kinase
MDISFRHAKGEETALSVADNGPGMTPEQLEALFMPYYRTKEAAASNVVGSGLGLFIVESLVKAQNGRIEVMSEAGQGSVFTIYLPYPTPESP